MKKRTVQTLVALVLSAIWAIALGYGHWKGNLQFLDRAEGALSDLRLLARGERTAPDFITIVAIDDDTIGKEGSYPLPRVDLAAIVDAVNRLQPRVIAVDLLLLDHGKDFGDAILADALAKRPAAIAAAAVFSEATQSIENGDNKPLAHLPRAERFLLPLKLFADHAAVGIVNLTTDKSGVPRGVPMLFRTNEKVELSFPLRVASLANGGDLTIGANGLVLAGRLIPTDIDHVLPLTFYGRRGTIRTISASSVLNGTVQPAAIRDRIVVIGATVTGGGDLFPTPFDPVMPGVEVISTAIANLTTGDGILRDRSTRFADAILALALTLLLVGLLAWRRTAVGLFLMTAVMLIWLVANVAAFSHGVWLSAALPLAAAAPPALLFGALQLWSNRRQAQHFAVANRLLQQFQAPALRRWLTKNPEFLIEPVHQDAAIVFIDLSGFTSLSETLGMNAIQEMLKDFHALVDREVVARGGVITSFLGDGAMILFGLPESTSGDADNSALCCVNLCRQTERWIESQPPSIAARSGFKIGAHFGPIVASRLGGGSFQHITATGDSVNVASRLMEVAATHGAALAVSDDLLRRASPECALREFGVLSGPSEALIRGRARPVAVWLWRDDQVVAVRPA